MAVPADGFQVIDLMSPSMRALALVRNVVSTLQPAPRAAATALLENLSAMKTIHGLYQRLELQVLGPMRCLGDQLILDEGPQLKSAARSRQGPNLVSGQNLRSFSCHGAPQSITSRNAPTSSPAPRIGSPAFNSDRKSVV